VTEGAARPQALLVLVVLAVARDAVERRVLVRGAQVALLARRDGMKSDQGEARQIVIEKHLCSPPVLVVAALTLLALLPAMDIVGSVTAVAGRSELRLVEGPAMAGLATDLPVRAAQRVGGLVVVEGDTLPLLDNVAGLALGAIAAPVVVIVAVTTVAGRAQRGLEDPIRVAGGAADLLMSAPEGKRGLVVVEGDALPLLDNVAGLALGAIAAPVDVVLTVTARTGGAELGLVEPIRVAGGAADLLMSAPEGKRGLVVVEGHALPGFRYMAGLALVTVSTTVDVVDPVTRYALHRGVLVPGARVADGTADVPVLSS